MNYSILPLFSLVALTACFEGSSLPGACAEECDTEDTSVEEVPGDADTDSDTDSDSDGDTDTDTDTETETKTLCWDIEAVGAPACADWVEDEEASGNNCSLSEASFGTLWVWNVVGWTPVASSSGGFDLLCAEVEAASGEELILNGQFSSAQVPQNYGGLWWVAANWYGSQAWEGTVTIDGDDDVAPVLVGNNEDGSDLEIVFSMMPQEMRASGRFISVIVP